MPARDTRVFFFNDTATTEIYTLSLHDALPISHFFRNMGLHTAHALGRKTARGAVTIQYPEERRPKEVGNRKSTRLNSSHGYNSYAVFCLKKKTAGHEPPVAELETKRRAHHICC